jgi:hypothetical protein
MDKYESCMDEWMQLIFSAPQSGKPKHANMCSCSIGIFW